MQELKKEDVKKVIEGRGHGDHTPMLYDMWIYPWIYEERREAFEKFMDAQIKDVDFVDLAMPDNFHAPEGYPDYKWAPEGVREKEGVGIDGNCVAEEWEDMEALSGCGPCGVWKMPLRTFICIRRKCIVCSVS